MAFKKRKITKVVEDAKKRVDGMTQIDIDNGIVVDYGDAALGVALTKTEVKAKILSIETGISAYNQMLEQADAKANDINASVDELRGMNTAVLKSAVGKFGEDGNEIEQLGGTRKSERKRPVRKPPVP